MLSLLFLDDYLETDEAPEITHANDIMLDKVLSAVTPDIRLQNAALKVLCKPLVGEHQIIYRREIAKDFLANKLSLSKMKELFRQFCNFKLEYQSRKKQIYRLSSGQDGTTQMLDAVKLVQFGAYALKKQINLINDIHSLLCAAETTSCGINRIKQRVSVIVQSSDMHTLLEYAGIFEHYTLEETVHDMKFNIDESGKMSGLELSKVRTELSKKPEAESLFSIFRKKKTEPLTEIKAQFNPNDNTLLITNAIRDVTAAIEFVINSISDEFGGISDELMFYDFVMKYCEALDKSGVAYCFPEFSNDTKISGLYDLYLLFTRFDPSTVVPNGFVLKKDTKGILIGGDNSSGKTVYLRSIAMAYIFTQAGLPIPANSAQVALQNGLSIQMASAEKTLRASDSVGRFEEEVIELKDMINTISPNSLAFFNEIFQTTDYAEGAEGLYCILEYLNRKGIRWILVTHLTQLANMYSEQSSVRTLLMSSVEKYKVCNSKVVKRPS